jgi:hypothetical protein
MSIPTKSKVRSTGSTAISPEVLAAAAAERTKPGINLKPENTGQTTLVTCQNGVPVRIDTVLAP